MADATTTVRYFQDVAQTQGPYTVEFKTEDEALAFITSIGTGEVVAPEPEPVTETPEPVAGDNSATDQAASHTD